MARIYIVTRLERFRHWSQFLLIISMLTAAIAPRLSTVALLHTAP